MIGNDTLSTTTQWDDRTPHWAETLAFHTCSPDDDLILGPWYSTLAYLKGHQVQNNDNPVTWMLYDSDNDYVFFTVDVFDCGSSYHMSPSLAPSMAPSKAP